MDWKVTCSKGHMFVLRPAVIEIRWDWAWVAHITCPVCGEQSPWQLQTTSESMAITSRSEDEELAK